MLMLLVLVTGESHGVAVRAESGPRSAPIPVFPRAEGGAQDRESETTSAPAAVPCAKNSSQESGFRDEIGEEASVFSSDFSSSCGR